MGTCTGCTNTFFRTYCVVLIMITTAVLVDMDVNGPSPCPSCGNLSCVPFPVRIKSGGIVMTVHRSRLMPS